MNVGLFSSLNLQINAKLFNKCSNLAPHVASMSAAGQPPGSAAHSLHQNLFGPALRTPVTTTPVSRRKRRPRRQRKPLFENKRGGKVKT